MNLASVGKRGEGLTSIPICYTADLGSSQPSGPCRKPAPAHSPRPAAPEAPPSGGPGHLQAGPRPSPQLFWCFRAPGTIFQHVLSPFTSNVLHLLSRNNRLRRRTRALERACAPATPRARCCTSSAQAPRWPGWELAPFHLARSN